MDFPRKLHLTFHFHHAFIQDIYLFSAADMTYGHRLIGPSSLSAFSGHRHWVLTISWSPDGLKLASGCKNGQVCAPHVFGLRSDPATKRGEKRAGPRQPKRTLRSKVYHLPFGRLRFDPGPLSTTKAEVTPEYWSRSSFWAHKCGLRTKNIERHRRGFLLGSGPLVWGKEGVLRGSLVGTRTK